MRRGVVAAINQRRGMIAIKTEDSGYTIVELLRDWDVDVGDEIAWANGYGLGSEIYENRTKGVASEVYVQNHDVSEAILKVQLRL
jgi:uncharacterized membrane-anchored protein